MLVFAQHGQPLSEICDRRGRHYLTSLGRSRNSKKSTYWISLLEKLNKIDPELTSETMIVKQEVRLFCNWNLSILYVGTYPELPGDVFFTAVKIENIFQQKFIH